MTAPRRPLRHRLVLQDAVDTPVNTGPNAGDYSRTYTTVQSLSADMESIKPRIDIAGMQVETKDTHKFTVRFNTAVRAERYFRLESTFGNRLFRIDRTMDIEERHEWMLVYCEELQDVV